MQNSPVFISIARMHHIRSRTKFRRLQQRADHANVSGLAKTGRPGVLVFEGKKDCVAAFLEGARSLRYLDFHHVATRPLPVPLEMHVAGTKPGLREVKDMKTLIHALEAMSLQTYSTEHRTGNCRRGGTTRCGHARPGALRRGEERGKRCDC
ncbi:hypothetical protein C8R43DRAFT_1045703, partial [Mycena crocata]